MTRISTIDERKNSVRKVILTTNPQLHPFSNAPGASQNYYCKGVDMKGFQIEIDLQALPPGVSIEQLAPNQVWWVEKRTSLYRLYLYGGTHDPNTRQINSTATLPWVATSLSNTVYYVGDPKYTISGQIGVGNEIADTAALNAAAQDMINNGSGVLLLPPTALNISSFPTFTANSNGLPYALRGYGKNLSIINSYATSLSGSLTVNAPDYFISDAPEWSGFTINGNHATNDAVGLHWSDVSSASFRDITIQNFTATSGIGMLFHNQVGWTETIAMDAIELINNTICMDFVISPNGYPSFDYWTVNSLYIGLQPNQSGIVDEVSTGTKDVDNHGIVQHIGSLFNVTTNCQKAYTNPPTYIGTNTGSFMWIKGRSQWIDCIFNIRGETDGNSAYIPHTPIRMDATGLSAAYIIANGTFNLVGFDSPIFAAGNYQFEFQGYTNLKGKYYKTTSNFVISSQGTATYVDLPPNTYPFDSPINGQNYINYYGSDINMLIPITMKSGSTLKYVQQNYNVVAAGPTILTAPNDQSFIFPVLLHANEFLRIDVSSGTVGATNEGYFTTSGTGSVGTGTVTISGGTGTYTITVAQSAGGTGTGTFTGAGTYNAPAVGANLLTGTSLTGTVVVSSVGYKSQIYWA